MFNLSVQYFVMQNKINFQPTQKKVYILRENMTTTSFYTTLLHRTILLTSH